MASPYSLSLSLCRLSVFSRVVFSRTLSRSLSSCIFFYLSLYVRVHICECACFVYMCVFCSLFVSSYDNPNNHYNPGRTDIRYDVPSWTARRRHLQPDQSYGPFQFRLSSSYVSRQYRGDAFLGMYVIFAYITLLVDLFTCIGMLDRKLENRISVVCTSQIILPIKHFFSVSATQFCF